MAANLLDNGTIKDFREKIRMIVGIVIRFKVMVDPLNLRDGATRALGESGLVLPPCPVAPTNTVLRTETPRPLQLKTTFSMQLSNKNFNTLSHELDSDFSKLSC